ncbi:MAG: ammonia-forming cytochrome c nitrite reductase subunit c552 [Planctomycetota bacterium]|nr:ammonia-forming cytochrome c nitrite reductase subunit c552 [Planctomycetota bacterium]
MNTSPQRHSDPSPSRDGKALIWATFVIAAAGTVAIAALLMNIGARKAEGQLVAFPLTRLSERIDSPSEWGKNFPRQYDGYMRTVDNQRARFGGSESMPLRELNASAPGKQAKAPSKLEEDPLLKTIFNGYAFAIDYRERRGHAFMLDDQRDTERVKQKQQPGACLNCHASNVLAYREFGQKNGAPGGLDEPLLSANGQAQLFKGFEVINSMKYADATALVQHPVACIDCHEPDSMKLRITRPAFIEGIQALAKSDDSVPHLPSIEQWRKSGRSKPYDPNELASRQEMRSMSCGQCHVEYYFKGEQKRLTFPWHNGLKVEQEEAYYNDTGWNDWTHKESGAAVLKAQHPEFELWSQGVHARSGVSCADCHMPYVREGAMKFSSHQVQSPMNNVARSCQVCHNYTETEIVARVDIIQKRTKGQLDRAEVAVVDLIHAITAAKAVGATDDQLKPARELQRKAQWRADYINAENSMGFHAPAETLRILGESIDYARQGELAVAKLKIPAK